MVCGPVLGVIDALLKKVRDRAFRKLGLVRVESGAFSGCRGNKVAGGMGLCPLAVGYTPSYGG